MSRESPKLLGLIKNPPFLETGDFSAPAEASEGSDSHGGRVGARSRDKESPSVRVRRVEF